MKKKITVMTLITLVFLTVVCFSACQAAINDDSSTENSSNQSQTKPRTNEATSAESSESDQSADDVVKAYDLFEAYKDDPSKKEPTNDGENVVVNGVITYIGRDSHGTPSINLSDKANGTGYVLCVFDSFDELDAFSLGQEVTVSANFHIMGSDGMVVLKQSKVL
ncbi:OB-fold protein [Listeria monocytogenes]|uniref:OB-fold protein n=1 Tax=Listeria monocytogenes TaxID=1639 RepID=UPI000F138B30|nr:hypothetical protein [Listeria monocytogenes]EAC3456755.1 hypothetical protein [Listeria monocytogenes]EAC4365816.1 hypothetical protein [Listeria monocytogenes]EAC4831016.1 hypothetical protein [Listeria monocytogenes]EAC5024929.1 hypothetical protein [Listeria monocytogenes]EAC6175371.1 hypothetical protein [Listeria monocytogenes]